MKITDGFALREVAGEQVLMPVGENINKFEGAIILNDVAAFAYKKLAEHPEGLDIKKIAECIADVYEADPDTAEKDIGDAFEKLREYGALSN